VTLPWRAGWRTRRSAPRWLPPRNHDLDDDGLAAAETAWDEYWAAVRPVELTGTVERHAGQLARKHALQGADAVHLASALVIGDPDLVVAVWDRRLHAGAREAGALVAPARLVLDT
jgi:uncharacterized protein